MKTITASRLALPGVAGASVAAAGLDFAIVNAEKLERFVSIPE